MLVVVLVVHRHRLYVSSSLSSSSSLLLAVRASCIVRRACWQTLSCLQTSVYDAPGVDTVDVVLSNHKSNTTAQRAMAKLQANPRGGVYVTLDEDTVATPPPHVRQVDYDMFNDVAKFSHFLDALARHIVNGTLKPIVEQSYDLVDVRTALQVMAEGHVMSKLAIVPQRAVHA